MVKFLIDVNLPKMFKFWSGEKFLHVVDLNNEWSDSKIWEYAKTNHLTIVTKDADFSNRIISAIPPPKGIHIKIGNMRMKNFHDFIAKNWEEISKTSQNHKLVNVYQERIIAIA